MPRRYTTRLHLEKRKDKIEEKERQQNAVNSEDSTDNEDEDGTLDAADRSMKKTGPTRIVLESSRHHTHPALNQGLSVGMEPLTQIYPNASFAMPMPVYIANRMTAIVDPCRLRPSLHEDWNRHLLSLNSKYQKNTRKQRQREQKHKHHVYDTNLFDMAEHIASQENTYFRDSYDYYYTGGNLAMMPSSEQPKLTAIHVAGEKLQQLQCSRVVDEAKLWQTLHTTTSFEHLSSEIFEVMPVSGFRVNHGNMFLTRQLNDIGIYELIPSSAPEDTDDDDTDEDEDRRERYTLDCQCNYKSEDGAFISVAQAINRPHIFGIACEDRSIHFLDILTQEKVSKHNVSIERIAVQGSAWAQMIAWQENCFYYACQTALLNVDMRCPNEAGSPCFASSAYTKYCESFSCLRRSLNPNLLYLASNHKLHCLDVRCLGMKLSDRAVVTWTHQMSYAPTFMDAIVHEGSEYVALANAIPHEQRICELKGALASRLTEMSSPTLPYAPPQVEEALLDAQLQGERIDLYADLLERVKSSTTGMKFHRLNDSRDGAFAQLFTSNSVGDVYGQRVTPRDELEMRQQERRTGPHTSSALKHFANEVNQHVKRKLRCTEVRHIPVIREILKSETERSVVPEKPEIVEDIEIEYGFDDSDSEVASNGNENSQSRKQVPPASQQDQQPSVEESPPADKKMKCLNRGAWQKSAFALGKFTDVISMRMLSIWDMDDFEALRDVNIDMIDEKLKREMPEKNEDDRTVSWLQQVPDNAPDDVVDEKPEIVPGTKLRTHYDAVHGEHMTIEATIVNSTEVDGIGEIKIEENLSINEISFTREPPSILRPGEFTVLESEIDSNPNPTPAKRRKTKFTMGF